tara:strand:- start:982 stop:1410 length:429 start_codon:yes stop_codon:yes gene_type:complete
MSNIKSIIAEYLQEQGSVSVPSPPGAGGGAIDWSGGTFQGGVLTNISGNGAGQGGPPTPGGGIDWGGGQNQGGILTPIMKPDFTGGGAGAGGGQGKPTNLPPWAISRPQVGIRPVIGSGGQLGVGGRFVLQGLGDVKPLPKR